MQADRKPNTVVQAMQQEAEKMIQNIQAGPLRDAALIVAGNQVEHYEMAAYGSLRNFAQIMATSNACNCSTRPWKKRSKRTPS